MRKTVEELLSIVALSSTLVIGACTDDRSGELDGGLQTDARQPAPNPEVDAEVDASTRADASGDLDASAGCKVTVRPALIA